MKYTQRHSKHLQLVQRKNIAMASVDQTFVAQSNLKYKPLEIVGIKTATFSEANREHRLGRASASVMRTYQAFEY